MINIEALFKISYGLYIVSSGDEHKGNGFVCNTVFQVSSKPAKFVTCCNKDNLTAAFIQKHQAFSATVLEQDVSSDLMGKFGYQSGRDVNKMEGIELKYGETGVPIVLSNSLAYLECKVVETVDVGSHLMFIGELVSSEVTSGKGAPLTYDYFREVKKGVAPKNAPTFVDKTPPKTSDAKVYKCLVCGHIYDDALEEVKFEDLPEDWKCPTCSADKEDFDLVD